MRKIIYLLIVLSLILSACKKTQPTATVPPPLPTHTATASPTPTETAPPTDTPYVVCTPPACGPDEVYYCPGECLGGCGTECATPTPGPTTQPTEEPIFLSIIWHQHQPVYYKDPATGIYDKPWVRNHAAKDYVDMAAILQQYPNVHVTFNLTPSLIRQIDDLVAGARDLPWVMTEKPAAQLTDEDKAYIEARFFDTNPKIVARFPRYQELAADRENAADWSEQDYRDLQVLFNLAWVDPDWLAEEPLKALVEKGRDFSEEDKQTVLGEHLRLLGEVIPLHKALQEAGQIEVTMTPFAHPILPLLIDTNQAQQAMPSADLPVPPFRYGRDAVAQLEKGVELYREHFGVDPRGMWPGEGSVAQVIVNMVGRAGIQWMASDEEVLAKSIGLDSFTRAADDLVVELDKMYRPYYVVGADGIPVAMVFRDHVISDKVGFTYSGLPGNVAAADLIKRVHDIRAGLMAAGAQGPHLVTVILDGENAWEYYENDGKEFLHTLYQKLSDDPLIVTVTPSEFLAIAPDPPTIENLWAGSWISHDFSTWIGEDEENLAWNYLRDTRDMLQKYATGIRQIDAETLAQALDQMYIAEGSDWFWWYGADQNSGNDESFDASFRNTLKQVYLTLGEEPPLFLDVPVIPLQAQAPDQSATGLISPTIDGLIAEGEWDAAGCYLFAGGVMASSDDQLDRFCFGFDAKTLYLRVDARQPWADLGDAIVGLYLLPPGGGAANPFSHYGQGETLLGFGATRLAEIVLSGGVLQAADLSSADGDGNWQNPQPIEIAAAEGAVLEVSIPYVGLGALDTGDQISMRAVLSAGAVDAARDLTLLPAAGPAKVAVPDLGLTTTVLEIADPEGDDHGPGSYTYATDAVHQPGVYDLTGFSVGYDDEYIVFKFTVAGAVDNVWGSPNGVSVQTFDVYIDQDGPENGSRLLLPGRNVALTPDYAWDLAVWVEGWTPGVYVVGDDGLPTQVDAEMVILADPGQSKVTVRVPKSVLGDDPQNWAYAVTLAGQEGFPAGGVWRIRDVNPASEQWRFGGAPADTNHTRLLDIAWPADAAPTQEDMLSNYPSSDADPQTLGPDDFAQIGMLMVQ
jgi:alpha-amylase/alpha-mannosidase (GH57 family)